MIAKVLDIFPDRIIINKGNDNGVEEGMAVKVGEFMAGGDAYPEMLFTVTSVQRFTAVAEFIYAYHKILLEPEMTCEIVGEKIGLIDN